ncbi:MAG: DUF1015 family protein [Verrucomicrobiota bacterium]|nr:DUF1015 family protein [Verrucomicrobiota bacterium]
MATVHPFNALMPSPEKAPKIAAVPYDVVNTEEASELAKNNMLSFLRVSRPEIELEEGINLYSDEVYQKAAENFKRLRELAPLKEDPQSSLYIYSLVMDGRRQTGIVAAASVDDYDNEIIKKHEKTRKAKEDDRTRHILTLRSQTGPVFLTYRDTENIMEVCNNVMEEKSPLFELMASDGISHEIWRLSPEEIGKIVEKFENIPSLYIADGHHRAASASRCREILKNQNSAHRGNEEYNRFLTVIFPASQMHILAYNRAIYDLNGLSEDDFLKKIQEKFKCTETNAKKPVGQCEFSMYLGGKWYTLKPSFDISTLGVIEGLDVSILQDNILAPLLGIADPRTSNRVDFVGGIRGPEELERLVDSGKAQVAFSMYPTTIEQLMQVSDADLIMPPKSTWFEPKLRDGLLSHNI